MKRLPVIMLGVLIITAICAVSQGERADAATNPVTALQTQVAGLVVTVNAQSTQIAVLQTAVAHGPSQPDATVSDAETITIQGTLALIGDKDNILGDVKNEACYGTGGYNDIFPGAPITVRDKNGTVVSTGDLGDGTLIHAAITRECDFDFTVDAPKLDFYSIEISHRGELTYSYDDLVEQDFNLQLSIGD